MSVPRRRAGRAAGFTLVEMLVALAIVGVVSLLMLNGIGLAGQGLNLLSRRAMQLDERRGLEILMRRALAAAIAVPADGRPAFVGRPTSVTFLSVIEDGGPGLYRFTLAFDPTGPQPRITLVRRLAGSAALPGREESVLVRGVRAFDIAYFGAVSATAEPRWHQHWEGITYLPTLIRIILDTPGSREQPPIVLRLWDAG